MFLTRTQTTMAGSRLSASPTIRLCAAAVLVFFCVAWSLADAHGHGHAHGPGGGGGHDHDHHHGHDEPTHEHFYHGSSYQEGEGHEHEHDHHDHGHHHHHDHDHDHDHMHEPTHEHFYHASAYEKANEHEHHEHHHHEEEIKSSGRGPQRDTMTIWLSSLTATALISAAPVIILLFIPLEANTAEHQPLLKVLLSFASGGLLGDAFLHLIPHATSPHTHGDEDHGHGHGHSHGHSHSHGHGHSHGDDHGHSHDIGVGLWVIAGILAFLIVEKFVRYVKGGHGHSHGAPGHTHNAPPEEKGGPEEEKPEGEEKEGNTDDKEEEGETELRKRRSSGEKEEEKSEEKDGDVQKEDEDEDGEVQVQDIKIAGYLNLVADFSHNFTDGMAIGASFLVGRSLGIITTLTILLHEVPHEIGDFAILVQSGCSKKKAMLLQFSTATGAMAGTVFGLLAGGGGVTATTWILPFTAGGFIYIATVSVIPELLEGCSSIWQSFKEIAALLVGVYMMVLIGELEEM